MDTVSIDTARVAAKLAGDETLSERLRTKETMWEGICHLQNLLNEKECSKFFNLLGNDNVSTLTASPQQRVDAFLKSYKKP